MMRKTLGRLQLNHREAIHQQVHSLVNEGLTLVIHLNEHFPFDGMSPFLKLSSKGSAIHELEKPEAERIVGVVERSNDGSDAQLIRFPGIRWHEAMSLMPSHCSSQFTAPCIELSQALLVAHHPACPLDQARRVVADAVLEDDLELRDVRDGRRGVAVDEQDVRILAHGE